MNNKISIAQKTALTLIAVYREVFGKNKFLAPIAPLSCRFYPTCSEFSEQAILKYGIKMGVWLTTKRLLRCTPFFGKSGYDPVK